MESLFSQWLDWIDTHGLRDLFIGVPLFFVLSAVFSGIRRFLWSRLRRWADVVSNPLDLALLDAAETPFKWLLYIAALAFSMQFLSPYLRGHPIATYLPKLALVLVGIWLLDRALRIFLQSGRAAAKLNHGERTVLVTFSRIVFSALGLLIVLDTFGISITPILASLGVGSVAVALALQDTLGNFFSGIYLLLDKPIQIGNFVKLADGSEGRVKRIGWRSTHIELLSNSTIVIPNSKLSTSTVVNYDLPRPELSVGIPVGISYEEDLERVEKITLEVAREVIARLPGASKNSQPVLRFSAFNQSSIDFTVFLEAARFSEQSVMRHEFIKALYARYRKENISIPYPQHVVHLEKGPS